MMVERRELHPPVATVIAFTVSFSGVNVSAADLDMNATLPPAVEARVMRAAMSEVEQLPDVKVRKRGGEGIFYCKLLLFKGLHIFSCLKRKIVVLSLHTTTILTFEQRPKTFPSLSTRPYV